MKWTIRFAAPGAETGRGALMAAVSTAVLAAAVTGAAVRAQDADAVDETPATASDDADRIRVEGDRLEGYGADASASDKFTRPLVETPKSVSIITNDLIEDAGATSLADVLRTVPGITMAMGEGGQPFSDRPFIRGFESTSGTLIDGVRDTGSQNRDAFALEQVEVVKGPSGAFAGRGAPGGSINLVTKSARNEAFTGGSLTLGTSDYVRATADVNRPLSDTVGVRLAAMWQSAEVDGRDAVFDDRWGVAPTITVGLDRPTQVTVDLYHYETEGLADYGLPYSLETGQPVDVDRDNFYGLTNRDFSETYVDAAGAELAHAFDNGFRLRNFTRYTQSENDYIATNPDDSQGNLVNGLVARIVKSRRSDNETIINQTDLTGEFDLGGMRNTFAAGIELGREETNQQSYNVEQLAPGGVAIPRGGCDQFGAGAPSGYNCTDLENPTPDDPWTGAISLNPLTTTEAETISAYAFDTIDLAEQWSLNLGVRWDDFDTETSTGLSNADSFVNYQAGLVYQPVENASVYVSYGTSSSPSGVTVGDGGENIASSNEDLQPERNINYELGAKWIVDERLSLTAAVFRNVLEDGHVSSEPGRGAPQIAIGEQRVDGVELSASGAITDDWQIFGGYTYLNSEIVDPGPVTPEQAGNALPNTPEHALSLWSTYAVTESLAFGGGAFYRAKIYGDTANAFSAPDYWRFDAFASYAINDDVQLRLNVLNLTDETIYDRAYTRHMVTVAPGRSVRLTADVRF